MAGNGSIRKRAAAQLQRLAENLGVGVVNTFMGKGAVPMDNEHCLFTMGLGSGDYNNLAFDDADLVIYWRCAAMMRQCMYVRAT